MPNIVNPQLHAHLPLPGPFTSASVCASFSDCGRKQQMPKPLETNPQWPSQGDPSRTRVQPSSKGQASEEQKAGSGQE